MAFRSIPGENPFASSDVYRAAYDRAGGFLAPYYQKYGLRPPGEEPFQPIVTNALSPDSDRLYKSVSDASLGKIIDATSGSVSDASFAKVMDAIKDIVIGKGIPGQKSESEKLWERKQFGEGWKPGASRIGEGGQTLEFPTGSVSPAGVSFPAPTAGEPKITATTVPGSVNPVPAKEESASQDWSEQWGQGLTAPEGRERGGPTNALQAYKVGEAGPEYFIPFVPGVIRPGVKPIPRQEGTPEGQVDTPEGPKPISPVFNAIAQGGLQLKPEVTEMLGESPEIARRAYEVTTKPWVDLAANAWRGAGEKSEQFFGPMFERIINPLVYMNTGYWPPPMYGPGEHRIIDQTRGLPSSPMEGPLWGKRPIGPDITGGGARPIPPTVTPGWSTGGEGIDYKLGPMFGTPGYGAVIPRPDLRSPEALEIAARDRWADPEYAKRMTELGYSPGYQRTYYEAHPAEGAAQNIYDLFRGPGPNSYEAARERMFEDRMLDIASSTNVTEESRKMAVANLNAMRQARAIREGAAMKAASDAYAAETQYGGAGTAAETEERLAHAAWLRAQPEIEMYKTDVGGRARMREVAMQIEGQLAVAQIQADVKNNIMGEITKLHNDATTASRYTGQPVSLSEIARKVVRTRRAFGQITDEQWAKLPPAWTQTRMMTLYGKDPSVKGGIRAFSVPEDYIDDVMARYPTLTAQVPK